MTIGLIVSAMLLALPLMAWPIYLHLLKPKQRIQVVPSLKLFALLRKKARTRRVEDLLLLLARLFAFLFLVLLAGQPYWRTSQKMSLPDLAEKQNELEHPLIGIVLDDSLCAMHARNGRTRLDECRIWMLKQLDALPDNLRCAIVTTGISSDPIFLPKEQAMRVLGNLSPMPLKGDACRALKQVETAMSGRKGLVLVMASRDSALWRKLKAGEDFSAPAPVFFFDTTDYQTDAFIRSVTMSSHGVSNSEWLCRLDGTFERTKDMKLSVHDQAGHEISPAAIVRGGFSDTVNIRLTPESSNMCYEVALNEKSAHPWLSFYFSAFAGWERDNRAVIFREDNDAARLADNVLTAAIRAIRPQAEIVHVSDTASIVNSPPGAAVIVAIGNVPFSQGWRTWLDSEAEKGARILCVPCISGQSKMPEWLSRNAPDFFPTWAKDADVLNSGDFPLQLDQAALLKVTGIAATNIMSVFQESSGSVLCEAVSRRMARGLLKTRQNRFVLAVCSSGNSTMVFSLGLPLTLRDGSFAYHPGFPVLVKSLLFPDPTDACLAGEPVVGDTVNLNEWFDQKEIGKTLVLPDGSGQEIRSSLENPKWMTLSAAGFYRLGKSGDAITRVVNYPRAPDLRVVTRAEWQGARPNTTVKWLDQSSRVLAKDFSLMSFAGKAVYEHQYDLSGIAAVLLVVFLAAESLMLWLRWRAKSEDA